MVRSSVRDLVRVPATRHQQLYQAFSTLFTANADVPPNTKGRSSDVNGPSGVVHKALI